MVRRSPIGVGSRFAVLRQCWSCPLYFQEGDRERLFCTAGKRQPLRVVVGQWIAAQRKRVAPQRQRLQKIAVSVKAKCRKSLRVLFWTQPSLWSWLVCFFCRWHRDFRVGRVLRPVVEMAWSTADSTSSRHFQSRFCNHHRPLICQRTVTTAEKHVALRSHSNG